MVQRPLTGRLTAPDQEHRASAQADDREPVLRPCRYREAHPMEVRYIQTQADTGNVERTPTVLHPVADLTRRAGTRSG